VQLLLVEYDEANNELEVWAERLDEVSRDYYIDPWNQVLGCVRFAGRGCCCCCSWLLLKLFVAAEVWNQGVIQLGSEINAKFKLRAVTCAHVTASKTGKHLGQILEGWRVRPDNQKTSADGFLRRESHGPVGKVGSTATGSDFSISEIPRQGAFCVASCPVFWV
jgi:hypothetical protein